LILGG